MVIGMISWLVCMPLSAQTGDYVHVDPLNFDDGAIMRVEHPKWFKQSFLDLREDLAEAKRAGKRGIALYFTTQGCSYCKIFLSTTFKDPSVINRVRENYDVIGLEMFSDEEITDFSGELIRVKHFAQRYNLSYTPSMVFYNTQGVEELRLVGYYPKEKFNRYLTYLLEGLNKTVSLRKYLNTQPKSSVNHALLRDAIFRQPPYILDRRAAASDRPLLVMFEQPECDACVRFHKNILSQTSVRKLYMGFETVRLNLSDNKTYVMTPEGKMLTAAQWADQLGLQNVPATVLFDEHGREITRLDSEVMETRMIAALNYVLEKGYEKYYGYQSYRRQKKIEQAMSGR